MDNVIDTLTQPDVLTVIGAIVLALVGYGLGWYKTTSRRQWVAFAQGLTPDELDAITGWAAGRAYDAVAQFATAYDALSNEEKQQRAARYIKQFFELFYGVKPPQGATVAMLESHIYRQKRKREAKPLPERVPDREHAPQS